MYREPAYRTKIFDKATTRIKLRMKKSDEERRERRTDEWDYIVLRTRLASQPLGQLIRTEFTRLLLVSTTVTSASSEIPKKST